MNEVSLAPKDLIKSIIGLNEDEVYSKLKAAGYAVRVMHRDEEDFIGTCEYRCDRINLYIDNNKVTDAEVG